MICSLFIVTCQQDANELTNHRSVNLFSLRFPGSLVLLYSGCRLVVGCSVTEALEIFYPTKDTGKGKAAIRQTFPHQLTHLINMYTLSILVELACDAKVWSRPLLCMQSFLALTVLVTAIDALGHFETG